jgi:hypothetical protein
MKMTQQVTSLHDDVTELAEHIVKSSPDSNDYRKERSKLGERHGRTIEQINQLLVDAIQKRATPEQFSELRRMVGGFLS